MKKFMILMAVAMISVTTFAQTQPTAKELAKQQKELNEINMKLLNAKPSKDAKAQAKKLKKEGWQVNAGDNSMEKQITYSQLMGQELMADEDGNPCKRFFQASGQSTGGTFNSAYSAARNQAMNTLAGDLETKIASAISSSLDNAQSSAKNAVTVDKFHQRAKSIIDASLTNSIPVLTIYRVLDNGNFEVQVRMGYDKKELQARLKRNLQKELEAEGDELNSLVDAALKD